MFIYNVLRMKLFYSSFRQRITHFDNPVVGAVKINNAFSGGVTFPVTEFFPFSFWDIQIMLFSYFD